MLIVVVAAMSVHAAAGLQSQNSPPATVLSQTQHPSLPGEISQVWLAPDATDKPPLRAQDLAAKHDAFGDSFRWHFIGHLQSRKTGVVNATCELVHSLDSESAARRLDIPAIVQVNLAGEETKSGVPPEQLEAFLAECPAEVVGLSTMPPLAGDPEASRPYFRRLRELAAEHGLADLSMGTSQDYRIAVEEGATLVRVGAVVFGEPPEPEAV